MNMEFRYKWWPLNLVYIVFDDKFPLKTFPRNVSIKDLRYFTLGQQSSPSRLWFDQLRNKSNFVLATWCWFVRIMQKKTQSENQYLDTSKLFYYQFILSFGPSWQLLVHISKYTRFRFSFHKKYIGSREEEYNIYGWKVNIDLNILFQDNNIVKGFLVVSLVQYARAITYLTFP